MQVQQLPHCLSTWHCVIVGYIGTIWHSVKIGAPFLTSPQPQSHPPFKLLDSDLGQVYKFKGGDMIAVLERLKIRVRQFVHWAKLPQSTLHVHGIALVSEILLSHPYPLKNCCTLMQKLSSAHKNLLSKILQISLHLG
jgi:hypothetical protein